MRGIQHTFIGAVLVAGLVTAGGCGGKGGGMGGFGGEIIGNVATNMMTGGAKKQAQQQADQQGSAQQAGTYLQPQQPQPTEYKPPAMDMAGTLVEKKTTDGNSAGWTFMQEGSAAGMPVDVSKVEADARALAGKKIILTGRYDTQSSGEAKIVAESLSVAGQ
jgi:hypothetical protein